MTIDQIPIEHFPDFNSGQTIYKSAKQDRRRVYGDDVCYMLRDLYLISDFKFEGFLGNIDGEFILFQIDTRIDYDVITSLN